MKDIDRGIRLNFEILAILGIKTKKVDFLSIDLLIRKGMPFGACKRIMKALDISKKGLSHILGITPRKLGSIEKLAVRLPLVASDRLYRTARVLVLAKELFGDEEKARSWLKGPQRGLGGRTPLDLLDTEVGTEEVENLIGRIGHGVIS